MKWFIPPSVHSYWCSWLSTWPTRTRKPKEALLFYPCHTPKCHLCLSFLSSLLLPHTQPDLTIPLTSLTLFYYIIGFVFFQLWNVLKCSKQYEFLSMFLSTFLICLEFWLCSWILHCPTIEYCLWKHSLCPSQLQVGIPVQFYKDLSKDKGGFFGVLKGRYYLLKRIIYI